MIEKKGASRGPFGHELRAEWAAEMRRTAFQGNRNEDGVSTRSQVTGG